MAVSAQIEQGWLRLRDEHPGDPELAAAVRALPGGPGARGVGLLRTTATRAVNVLDEALQKSPQQLPIYRIRTNIATQPGWLAALLLALARSILTDLLESYAAIHGQFQDIAPHQLAALERAHELRTG